MTTEEDAQTAALQEYFENDAPAGYGASFRVGWDAGKRWAERQLPDFVRRMCDDLRYWMDRAETADSVAQMAAHDRDEALEQAARFEQEYGRLQDAARSILWMAEKWAEGGGSRSQEMLDYEAAAAIIGED